MNRFQALLLMALAGAAGFLIGRAAPDSQDSTVASPQPAMASAPSNSESACPDPATPVAVNSAAQEVPSVPAACASAYAGMSPVDLLRLPTDFEQTAALYTMAQQADLDTLKNHIQDAQGIAIEAERRAALSILFSRFADLDPAAALVHYNDLKLQGQANILFPMFSGWAKSDVDAAIDRAKALQNPADRRIAERAILRANASASAQDLEWIAGQLGRAGSVSSPQALAERARAEPEAAAQTALALKDPQNRLNSLMWVLNTWADSDPEAALAFARGIGNLAERKGLIQLTIGKIAEKNPERAIRLAEKESPAIRQSVVQAAMMHLARTDPQRALQMAGDVKSSQQRQMAYSMVFAGWVQSDVEGAGLALENLSDLRPEVKQNLANTVVQAMLAKDPEAALAWAQRYDEQSGSPGPYVQRTWDTVVQQLANVDPQRALELARSLPSGMRRNNLVTNTLSLLATSDPQAALQNLDLVPSGEPRSQALGNIASSWAQQDPVMAMDWVLSLDPGERQQALQHVSWAVISADLDLAIAYTDDLTQAEAGRWIFQVIGQYASQDVSEAAAWLSQYDQYPEYGNWLGSIAQVQVATNPRRALAMLDGLTDPDQLTNAQLQVVSAWSQIDPKAVGRWWHKQAEDERNDMVLRGLVSSWASQDRDAARKWVFRLTSDAERDIALLSYVESAGHDWNDNEKWIVEIDNSEYRLQAYQTQLWKLMNSDVGRLDEFIQNARLDPAQKAQMEQQVDQMKQHQMGGIIH